MEGAKGLREADESGRWIVETKHHSVSWEIVVEPDTEDRLIVAITAYRLD